MLNPAFKPAMTEEELGAYIRLALGARGVVEFGCGGSTLALIHAGVGMICSVETDPGWISRCMDEPEMSRAVQSGRLKFLHADIGPVGEYGGPKDFSSIRRWSNYHHLIWDRIGFVPEFVMVDGRFRVATAVQAAARCHAGAKIAVHDYTWREGYHILDSLLPEAETIGTMRVFTVPERLDARTAVECLSVGYFEPA